MIFFISGYNDLLEIQKVLEVKLFGSSTLSAKYQTTHVKI